MSASIDKLRETGDVVISTAHPQTEDDIADILMRIAKSVSDLRSMIQQPISELNNGGTAATASGTISLANPSRQEICVQNRSTNVLQVTLDGEVTMDLKAASTLGAGDGGVYISNSWKGAVAVSGTSPNYTWWEF